MLETKMWLCKKTGDIFTVRQQRKSGKLSGWYHLHGLLLISHLVYKGLLGKDLAVDGKKMLLDPRRISQGKVHNKFSLSEHWSGWK